MKNSNALKNLKIAILDFILWCGCMSLISTVWVLIEVKFYGAPVPSREDTLMGMIFSALLWMEVRRWMMEKAEK